MATRGTLVEQIRRIMSGGDPSAPSRKIQEVREAVNQVLNKLLRADILSVNMPSGETIPDGYVIAHYDSKPVVQWKNRSRTQLPAIPIALPKGMGVYHVGPSGDPDNFYVPIPAGQAALMKTQPLINDLLGRIGYEVKDGYIIYHKDITAPPLSVTAVDIQLIAFDVSKYGDYDLLPIPAGMEADVISEVLKLFSFSGPQDNLTDSSAENTTK